MEAGNKKFVQIINLGLLGDLLAILLKAYGH